MGAYGVVYDPTQIYDYRNSFGCWIYLFMSGSNTHLKSICFEWLTGLCTELWILSKSLKQLVLNSLGKIAKFLAFPTLNLLQYLEKLLSCFKNFFCICSVLKLALFMWIFIVETQLLNSSGNSKVENKRNKRYFYGPTWLSGEHWTFNQKQFYIEKSMSLMMCL